MKGAQNARRSELFDIVLYTYHYNTVSEFALALLYAARNGVHLAALVRFVATFLPLYSDDASAIYAICTIALEQNAKKKSRNLATTSARVAWIAFNARRNNVVLHRICESHDYLEIGAFPTDKIRISFLRNRTAPEVLAEAYAAMFPGEPCVPASILLTTPIHTSMWMIYEHDTASEFQETLNTLHENTDNNAFVNLVNNVLADALACARAVSSDDTVALKLLHIDAGICNATFAAFMHRTIFMRTKMDNND